MPATVIVCDGSTDKCSFIIVQIRDVIDFFETGTVIDSGCGFCDGSERSTEGVDVFVVERLPPKEKQGMFVDCIENGFGHFAIDLGEVNVVNFNAVVGRERCCSEGHGWIPNALL